MPDTRRRRARQQRPKRLLDRGGAVMPNRITLRGCAPEPLIHYLKALGVLRLVAEQLDSGVRGAWHGDSFVLLTGEGEEALLNFFINDYRPTPIVAPWNGGRCFSPQYNKQRADRT